MKLYPYESVGFKFNLQGPATVEEFDQAAGYTGATLQEAIDNTAYRGSLAGVRDDLCAHLAETTGIERSARATGKTRTVIVKEADGTETESKEPIMEYTETEKVYINRVIATLASREGKSTDEIRASLQPIVDEIAKNNPIDPSVRERAPSAPKKPAAKWVQVAQQIIDAGRGAIVAAQLTSKLGFQVDPTLDSLAKGVAEDQRRKSLEAVKDYTV